MDVAGRPCRAVSAALLAVLLTGVLVLSGCAPGTPDADSWRDDAVRATGDGAAAASTLALALRHRDQLTGAYLQVVAVDAESSADSASQRLETLQPPPAEAGRHDRVTTALDDAGSVVREARTAVVAEDEAAYARLAEQLSTAADRLGALEDELRAAPGGTP